MKILVTEVEDWEKQSFQQFMEHHEVIFTDEPLNKDLADKYSDVEVICPFIYSSLQAQDLEPFSELKLIATRSTGFDHIDSDYCSEHDITVCNVPSYGKNTVAEHVFGLLLTISHNLREALDRTRRGDFSMSGLQGFDLRNKTLGVIGTGDIGQCVIAIAKGFGMRVLAFDVNPDQDAAEQAGFSYVGLEELLENSDIVTVHVPANKQTRHMISTEQFSRMREGAILINTSRGAIVDVDALLQALTEGRLRAAGLDVLPEEPTIREEAELVRTLYQEEHDQRTLLVDHVLLRLNNVYITPHSAFNTREAVQRILDTSVDNMTGFMAGSPQNVVVNHSRQTSS